MAIEIETPLASPVPMWNPSPLLLCLSIRQLTMPLLVAMSTAPVVGSMATLKNVVVETFAQLFVPF